MIFERFFRIVSYLAVFCGFLSLLVSGTFGAVSTMLFAAVMITAWMIEDSRWQIREAIGTALIVFAMPAFFFAYRFNLITISGNETDVAGILARMILSLTAIKLLQRKSDRDWIFLYLMAFFEVLLAAGLSISALYLASFLLYLLVMVCAVIAFEIRKTAHAVEESFAGKEPVRDKVSTASNVLPARRLPSTALALIVVIVALALPLFFMLPRVGGAGFGGSQDGLRTSSGFADTVRLGGIGRIQESDQIAMRVKLEGHVDTTGSDLYFRGVALDTFDNLSWSKSKSVVKEPFVKGDRDLVQVDYPSSRENLSVQTIYLEPMDTPVLFALPRAVAVQGNFPVLYKDQYGAFTYQRNFERISYKVLSDRGLPPVAKLRQDTQPYSADFANYRTLPPNYDIRIAELAETITADSPTRYDKARAVESYLQNNFGYTLEQKAGGPDPLANFLFDVREGHCEYFATAMAVMLRTQGVATRIVNGFHGGEYNDAADVTIVRQRNAHAWVEVFFPKENVWVPFDPTPFGGEAGMAAAAGFSKTINKYLEAFETFWIQYFVAYDNQEQRSLARSVRNGLVDYQSGISEYLNHARAMLTEWWAEVRGDSGLRSSLTAIGYALGIIAGVVLVVFLLVWLFRKIAKLSMWRRLKRLSGDAPASVVAFYETMLQILTQKGIRREPSQTPAEFAYALGIPEAVKITEKYNAVRFGERHLSTDESRDIEEWLRRVRESAQEMTDTEGGRPSQP